MTGQRAVRICRECGLVMCCAYLLLLPLAGYEGAPATNCDSCGVRCAYFLASLYGVDPPSLCELARDLNQAKDGTTTLNSLRLWLDKVGCKAEGRMLTYSELSDLRYPAIVPIQSACGPHFVIFWEVRDEDAVMLYPPKTLRMSEKEFRAKWDGKALVVLPARRFTLRDVSGRSSGARKQQSSIILREGRTDLGSFVLPLREPVVANFIVENVAESPIEMGKPRASCGCVGVTISRASLAPGQTAEIRCSVANLANDPGLKHYTVTIPLQEAQEPLFQISFTIAFDQPVSIQPRQLYFGQVTMADMPASQQVRVIAIPRQSATRLESATSSVPWIDVKVSSTDATVTLLPGAPRGRFKENVQIRAGDRALNIPVTGEYVGGFRLTPNPVILSPQNQYRVPFRITKTEGSKCNLKELKLTYEADQVAVEPQPIGGSSGQEFVVSIPDEGPRLDSYVVNVVDPKTGESESLTIMCVPGQ